LPATRDAVLERVTRVSQALNALISDESILGDDGPEVGPVAPPPRGGGR